MASGTPITEMPNPLSVDIDVASPENMLRILRQSDSQLFSGFQFFEGIWDECFLREFSRFIQHLQMALEEEHPIVISGSGTSGRMAFLMSKQFNFYLQSHNKARQFYYLTAGGDKSLVSAQEAPEDDVASAIRDLQFLENQLVEQGSQKIVFIGITCGLSAPYVAAQLDYALCRDRYSCILLGFNPAQFARTNVIEGWVKSFSDTLQTLLDRSKENCDDSGLFFHVLTPVIGPEAITGSTRMKGGSATMILLATAFSIAVASHANIELAVPGKNPIHSILLRFESAYRCAYLPTKDLSSLISCAGESLRENGRIYYVGVDALGLMGFIDASECHPTFGASLYDVRGFIIGGWNTIGNDQGDISSLGDIFSISHQDLDHILENFSSQDLLIVIESHNSTQEERDILLHLAHKAKSRSSKVGLIAISTETDFETNFDWDHQVCLQVEHFDLLSRVPCFAQFSLKLVLNAISTGAHVIRGMLFRNRMINVGINNHKLFLRAIGIVKDIAGTTIEHARNCVLRAIYQEDHISEEIEKSSIRSHVENASVPKVVPIALLLAFQPGMSVAEANGAINSEPIVRNILQKCIQQES